MTGGHQRQVSGAAIAQPAEQSGVPVGANPVDSDVTPLRVKDVTAAGQLELRRACPAPAPPVRKARRCLGRVRDSVGSRHVRSILPRRDRASRVWWVRHAWPQSLWCCDLWFDGR
jgi:hypothetical protein